MKTVFQHFSFCFSCSFLLMFSVKLSTLMASSLQDEKEMATHSSVLAWRIPGTVEPGGLPSMGLHRVGHD